MLMPKVKLLPCTGLLLLLLLVSLQTFSQTVTVKGSVVNASDNSPLSGVSIVDQSTNKGTTTDSKGAFSLGVKSAQSLLLFSSMGFQSFTLKWDGTAKHRCKT